MAFISMQIEGCDPVEITYEVDENDPNQQSNIQKLVEAKSSRNLLLKQTDRYATPDFPISDGKREEWKNYRQSLRDMDFSDLDNLSFPARPN